MNWGTFGRASKSKTRTLSKHKHVEPGIKQSQKPHTQKTAYGAPGR